MYGKSTCFFAIWTVNFSAKIGTTLINTTAKIEDESKTSDRKDAEKRGLLHRAGVRLWALEPAFLLWYYTDYNFVESCRQRTHATMIKQTLHGHAGQNRTLLSFDLN